MTDKKNKNNSEVNTNMISFEVLVEGSNTSVVVSSLVLPPIGFTLKIKEKIYVVNGGIMDFDKQNFKILVREISAKINNIMIPNKLIKQ